MRNVINFFITFFQLCSVLTASFIKKLVEITGEIMRNAIGIFSAFFMLCFYGVCCLAYYSLVSAAVITKWLIIIIFYICIGFLLAPFYLIFAIL